MKTTKSQIQEAFSLMCSTGNVPYHWKLIYHTNPRGWNIEQQDEDGVSYPFGEEPKLAKELLTGMQMCTSILKMRLKATIMQCNHDHAEDIPVGAEQQLWEDYLALCNKHSKALCPQIFAHNLLRMISKMLLDMAPNAAAAQQLIEDAVMDGNKWHLEEQHDRS